jgi:hypothetical protein
VNWLKLSGAEWVNLAWVRSVTPTPQNLDHLRLTFGDGTSETYGHADDVAALRARLDRLSVEQAETDQRYRAAHWQRMSEAPK